MKQKRMSGLNALYTTIIVSLLMVSCAVFYYLVIFLPQKTNNELEQKEGVENLSIYKEVANQNNLKACLDEVNKRFSNLNSEEYEGKKVSAAEAKIITDIIITSFKEGKEECYKRFPTK